MFLQELEDAVGVAVEEAGRDLLRPACQVLEDSWLERQSALNGAPSSPASYGSSADVDIVRIGLEPAIIRLLARRS